jgi:photosystem II stability/assembly factor-like uncharacterized protein
MRSYRLAAFAVAASLLGLPVAASGGARDTTPTCAVPAVTTDSWTEVGAPDDVTYPEQYEGWLLDGNPHYARVVDPYLPCRVFRIGTPAAHFADRNVVQRSLDGGRSWTTVLHSAKAGFAAQRLYVAAPGVVLVAEDGAGDAVLRSDDAGTTWRSLPGADQALAGEHAHSIGYAPGDARHLYVVTLPCRRSTMAGCKKTNADHGEDFVGLVALWHSEDGGATWQQSQIPQDTLARSVFKVAMRAGHPEEPFVFDELNLVVLHGQQGRILTTNDDGGTFEETAAAPQTLFDDFGVGTAPGGGALLYDRPLGAGTDFVSVDRGANWTDGGRFWKTERSALTALPSGRLVMIGATGFGGAYEGNELRAFFSDDLLRTWQESRTTMAALPPDYGYVIGGAQADAHGDVYFSYGVECAGKGTWQGPVDQCGGGSAEHRYLWHTVRYHPPAHGVELPPNTDPSARPATCTGVSGCALTARPPCALPAGATGSGLAFDGGALLYGDGARVRRVDPRTCREVASYGIRLDPTDLARAVALTRRTHTPDPSKRPSDLPTLDPLAPRIDAVTYDAVRDLLWFSLADATAGKVAQGNPAAVWSVRLHDPQPVARLAFASGRCLPHRGPGASMEVLAWDPEYDLLAACQQARPVLMTRDGVPDPNADTCTLLGVQRGYGYGWPVTSWTDLDGGRALLLVDAPTGDGASLVDYDLTSCAVVKTYAASAVGAAKTPGAMAQLACDPVTFAPSVAVWHRLGAVATPYLLPAGAVARCDIDTTTTPLLRGGRACAALTVTGAGDALAGERVRIRENGGPAATATTGPDGVACAGPSRAAGAGGGDVVTASFAGAGPYLASDGRDVFEAVPRAPRPPHAPRPVAPPAPPPPNPPAPPPPNPAPAPPAVAPGVPLVLPVPGAQAPVGGLSDEQEQQSQLAMVSQDATEQEPRGEGLLAAALLMATAAGAATWQRRTSAVRASVPATATVRASGPWYAPGAARRRRP